jgi:hypothetical protein
MKWRLIQIFEVVAKVAFRTVKFSDVKIGVRHLEVASLPPEMNGLCERCGHISFALVQ